MEKIDIWKREVPPLPFTLHVYRDSKSSYMVYDSSTVCGETVRSEPIDYDTAMKLANDFGMTLAQ